MFKPPQLDQEFDKCSKELLDLFQFFVSQRTHDWRAKRFAIKAYPRIGIQREKLLDIFYAHGASVLNYPKVARSALILIDAYGLEGLGGVGGGKEFWRFELFQTADPHFLKRPPLGTILKFEDEIISIVPGTERVFTKFQSRHPKRPLDTRKSLADKADKSLSIASFFEPPPAPGG